RYQSNGDRYIQVNNWSEHQGNIREFPSDWPKLRRDVIRRDGKRCRYCGSTDGPFHIDHLVPVSRGGSDEPSNLTVSCRSCNLSKCSLTASEFMEKISNE